MILEAAAMNYATDIGVVFMQTLTGAIVAGILAVLLYAFSRLIGWRDSYVLPVSVGLAVALTYLGRDAWQYEMVELDLTGILWPVLIGIGAAIGTSVGLWWAR